MSPAEYSATVVAERKAQALLLRKLKGFGNGTALETVRQAYGAWELLAAQLEAAQNEDP